MRTLLLFSSILALVLALAPTGATLDSSTSMRAGAVAGKVVDARGQAVAGAVVVIRGETASGRRFRARTKSGRDGGFGFRPVPRGHYVVASEVRGVGADRERVRVRAGHVSRVLLELQ